jgi:hypothetical protein
MPINVNILNTTNNDRTGIATCGIYFNKGEVTSTSQIITELGATGYVDFGGQAYPRLVKWVPFGANHSDGSYRFARASFHVELDPNRERKSTLTIHPVGVNPYHIQFPLLTNSNLTGLTQVYFDFSIDGQVVTIRGIDLTPVGTIGANDCVVRYKGFFRPFSRRSLWVELVVDLPNKCQTDSLGGGWSDLPVTNANFWFSWGNSYIIRNTGTSNDSSPYAYEQNTMRFNGQDITLTIHGAASHIRFSEQIGARTNLSTTSTRYVLQDTTNTFYRSNSIRAQACRMYRGVLFLGGYTSSAYADLSPTSTSPEITALAEGWGKYMPPVFADIPIPDNVARPSTENYRQDWIGRMNTLLQRGYGEIRTGYHPYGPHSARPFVPGSGAQGAFGCQYFHNPAYHLIQTAYPKEMPFFINSIMSNCFRGQWLYEEDGTHFQFANYPRVWIWSSFLFNNGSAGASSPDTCGAIYFPRLPDRPYIEDGNQRGNIASGTEEWVQYDREHSSVQTLVVGAILSADYFAMKFCEMWAEVYAAQSFMHVPGQLPPNSTANGGAADVIASLSADRAAARNGQSLIGLYFATGSTSALKSLMKKYWAVYLTVQSRRHYQSSRIDRLDNVEALSTSINTVGTVSYGPRAIGGSAGSTYNTIQNGNENPYFTPWQLSFMTVFMYQLSKLIEEVFPNGAYMTNYAIGSLVTTTDILSANPGGSNVVTINNTIAKSIAYDLANTVINYCTNYFGIPQSTYNWEFITFTVKSTDTVAARTLERLNQVIGLGDLIYGQSSGTAGYVVLVDSGTSGGGGLEVPYFTSGPFIGQRNPIAWADWSVGVWLKNCTGPGFTSVQGTGARFITEVLDNLNKGYSNPSNQGNRLLSGWYGTTAYCFDRNGSSNGLPGTGANYRKPLTQAQLEEVQSSRVWNNFHLGGPVWAIYSKDYGSWQVACATICIEGCRAGYYVTGDEVNYPVSALLTKAKQIVSDIVSISSVERSDWDQSVITFAGLRADWKDEGVVDIGINVIQSRAYVPLQTITTEYFVQTVIEIGSRNPNVRLPFNELITRSDIPQFVVFAEQLTNIDLKPLPVEDTRKENVQQVQLIRDSILEQNVEDISSAEIPQFNVVAVITPSLVVNKTINLAMGRPVQTPPIVTVPIITEKDPSDSPVSEEPVAISIDSLIGQQNEQNYYIPG